MINLLPPEVKSSIRFARLNVTLIQYCVLVILASATLSAILFIGITIISSSESEIESSIQADQVKVAELELINSEAQELAASVDTISLLLKSETKFSELIREIGSVLPPGATLSNLSLTQDKNAPLTLEVIADSPDTIGVMQENIGESELFIGAEIISVANSTAPDGGATEYTGSLNAYFNVAPIIPETPVEEPAAEEAS